MNAQESINTASLEKKTINSSSLILTIRDDLIFAEYIIHEEKHISGQRISKSWADEQHFYFDLEFSVEPSKIKRVSNKHGHKLLIQFPKETKTLSIAIGISQVDEAGALKNRQTELDGFNFSKTKVTTTSKWHKELSKIKISDEDREKASIFYTALYHCFIAPNLASDVDGRYRGHDQKIHELPEGEHHYTVFSLWDTYRTLHPLFTLIQPKEQKNSSEPCSAFTTKGMTFQYGNWRPVKLNA